MKKICVHYKIFIIPLVLFGASYFIYSFNLEDQRWHGDELNYMGSGGVYFNLIAKGNFSSPCWNDFPKCTELYYYGNVWNVNHGPVRDFFIGLGEYIVTGTNSGDYHTWSCFWVPSCWNNAPLPSPHDFAAARFFSPILGSLSIVCAYFIGKVMFSSKVGLFFSLILLFNSMWLWNSRAVMTEGYVGFFSLLFVLLLLHSFKNDGGTKKVAFILSAFTFGLLFNIKATAFYFIPLIVTIILLRISSNKQFPHFTNLLSRKSIIILILFIGIAIFSIVLTNPAYWKNITYPISSMVAEGSHYSYLTTPSLKNDNLFRTLATIHSTIFPYFFDYYDLPNRDVSYVSLKLGWDTPGTYSSIPVFVFFIVGMVYLGTRFKAGRASHSEFLMIVWFLSIFILTSLTVNDFRMERYYILLLCTIMLISAYGLWNFCQQLNKRFQVIILASFLVSHILTTMVFWKYIYFSPGVEWSNPLNVDLQASLRHNSVIISTIIFAIIFLITLSYKITTKNREHEIKKP